MISFLDQTIYDMATEIRKKISLTPIHCYFVLNWQEE